MNAQVALRCHLFEVRNHRGGWFLIFGFDALLSDAQTQNKQRKIARETAHLPGAMEAAIPYYRTLIRQHHAAMLAADLKQAMALREEAHLLAVKLNGGSRHGIISVVDENAPGHVLTREAASPEGAIPLWGQDGAFDIEVAGVGVRIEIGGMFGIGAGVAFWPGFSAHAIDPNRPFITETGYRSFLGVQAAPQPGFTPDSFAAKVIESYVRTACKGALVEVDPSNMRV